MVKNLALLAALASLAIAAPFNQLERRTDYSGAQAQGSITASAEFSLEVAAALEACIGGVVSSTVDVDVKAALSAWVSGAGAAYFDVSLVASIQSWCSADTDFTLDADATAAIQASLEAEADVSAAGGVVAYFSAYISASAGSDCGACTTIEAGKSFAGISRHESSHRRLTDSTQMFQSLWKHGCPPTPVLSRLASRAPSRHRCPAALPRP